MPIRVTGLVISNIEPNPEEFQPHIPEDKEDVSEESQPRVYERLLKGDQAAVAAVETDEFNPRDYYPVTRELNDEKTDRYTVCPIQTSAFMMFSNKMREKVKSNYPEATFGELGKIMGVMWRELGDDDKKHYNDLASKNKERYRGTSASSPKYAAQMEQ